MTPEKCMSMMLKTMAKIAEADQGAPVHDCVISVRRGELSTWQWAHAWLQ